MTENNNTDQQNLDRLLSQQRWQELLRTLRNSDPADTADYLEELSSDKRDTVFRLLDPQTASDVVVEMEPSYLEDVLEDMEALKLARLADEMASDDAVNFLNDLDQQKQSKTLGHMRNADEISRLLGYQEGTAGQLMTTEYCAVTDDKTVQEVRESLAPAEFTDPILFVYVIDTASKQFIGAISLQELFQSKPSKNIGDIADSSVNFCYIDDDQEEIARKFRKYDIWVMPVLDHNHRLMGRITADDIMDVLHEESDKDLAMMVGAPDIEAETTSAFKIARMRMPWLLITLASGLINSIIIKYFLDLTDIATISIFIPAILAMGGNTGIQSSAIAVRGIALGYQAYSRLLNLACREIFVGITMGLTCGTLTTAFVYLGFFLTNAQTGGPSILALGLTVGIAMCNAMVFATCFGAAFPLIIHRLGADPAVASGPFVTTSIDLAGALIYFLTCIIILM